MIEYKHEAEGNGEVLTSVGKIWELAFKINDTYEIEVNP